MADRRSLVYTRQLSAAELNGVRQGRIPRSMDDRWFAFVESDRLHVHRSWTGHSAFQADLLVRSDGGADVLNLRRNADQTQFFMSDDSASELFDRLLTSLASQSHGS